MPLSEDASISVKKLNIQKCEILLELAQEAQPHSQGSQPVTWHHTWMEVSFSQAGTVPYTPFTATYTYLSFSQKEKNLEKFLLLPAQNSKLLLSAEAFRAQEDSQGAHRRGLPMSPLALLGDSSSWHAGISFPSCSFHFCASPLAV